VSFSSTGEREIQERTIGPPSARSGPGEGGPPFTRVGKKETAQVESGCFPLSEKPRRRAARPDKKEGMVAPARGGKSFSTFSVLGEKEKEIHAENEKELPNGWV